MSAKSRSSSCTHDVHWFHFYLTLRFPPQKCQSNARINRTGDKNHPNLTPVLISVSRNLVSMHSPANCPLTYLDKIHEPLGYPTIPQYLPQRVSTNTVERWLVVRKVNNYNSVRSNLISDWSSLLKPVRFFCSFGSVAAFIR